MAKQTKGDLADLKPDPKNARLHNPRNVGMIETSMQRDGFGRSILLANDGTIIAGNATIDAAAQSGINDVLIVESDGKRVIAVKRIDIEPGSPAFHNLSLTDNRSAELAEWDVVVLGELTGIADLSTGWDAEELAMMFATMDLSDVEFAEYDESIADSVEYLECPECRHRWPK